MKKSSLLLSILLGLFTVCLVGTDLILKMEYNRIDKSDPFWNYTKLNKGSFHHLKLTGGNVTRIAFIQSPHASLGVLSYWEERVDGRIKSDIRNDTLFLRLEDRNESLGQRDWMKNHILIAITCPELYSVNTLNTNLDIKKLSQRALVIEASGRSRVEIESYKTDFDSLLISQRDTSQVIFEMADEIRSSGTLELKKLYADIRGQSILDVGHFRIQEVHQQIADTSAIIHSGYTLRMMK